MVLCDRYHIAGSKGVFYDRQPYVNTGAVHVTRFIGLAPVGNKDKQVSFLLICHTSKINLSLCI